MLSGIAPVHTVRLVRNPFSLRNRKGLSDLKKIINGRSWDVIWTNEPVMGVMTRVAAKTVRKKGTKVVYMVHGFHFYKGAPLTNWLLYYPVEKILLPPVRHDHYYQEEDYQLRERFSCGKNGEDPGRWRESRLLCCRIMTFVNNGGRNLNCFRMIHCC